MPAMHIAPRRSIRLNARSEFLISRVCLKDLSLEIIGAGFFLLPAKHRLRGPKNKLNDHKFDKEDQSDD